MSRRQKNKLTTTQALKKEGSLCLEGISKMYMTLKEAAAFLRLSPSSLYQRKDVPRFKLPGSRYWLYDSDTLTAWAQGRRESVWLDSLAPELHHRGLYRGHKGSPR